MDKRAFVLLRKEDVVSSAQHVPLFGGVTLRENLVKLLLAVELYDTIRPLLNVETVEVAERMVKIF